MFVQEDLATVLCPSQKLHAILYNFKGPGQFNAFCAYSTHYPCVQQAGKTISESVAMSGAVLCKHPLQHVGFSSWYGSISV